jgi:chemotaxis protein histidine kinase CheA
MAAAMGYHAVEQLAHALESLLDGVRRGESVPHDTLMSLLFDGTDALRASIEDAVEGRRRGTARRG